MYGQSSSPRRQQHAAEQHGTGIMFFYIPGAGIGMMASYSLRGLSYITGIGFSMDSFHVGMSMASYPLAGLCRI